MGFWSGLFRGAQSDRGTNAGREYQGEPIRQWKIGLAGEAQKNADGSSRQAVIRKCSVGDTVSLIREPNNRFDSNAILVCAPSGKGLGYIPADKAEGLAYEIDNGALFTAYIEHINGGEGRKSMLGVVIKVCLMKRPG